MGTDPTLIRLTAEVDRAVAALRAYVGSAPAKLESDLVEPQDAEVRYKISPDTRVRWAKNDNLGVKTDKGWCLYASLVLRHKGR